MLRTRNLWKVFFFVAPLLPASLAWAKVQEIDVEQALEMMRRPDTVVLDVRGPQEYTQGHIENARSFPWQNLRVNSNWVDLAPGLTTPILVYDVAGNKAAQARVILKDHGFANTYTLKGGIDAWKKAGLPVVSSAAPRGR